MKRRVAMAHLWATLASLAWIGSAALADADQRLTFVAPMIGAAVTFVLDRPTRRRRDAPTSGAVRSGRL